MKNITNQSCSLYNILKPRNGICIAVSFTIMVLVFNWISTSTSYVNHENQIASTIQIITDFKQQPRCEHNPSSLEGRNDILREEAGYSDLLKLFPDIFNGHIHPDDCQPDQKIAIIIPFRDRQSHLNIWLKNLIPLFKRQQRDVTIFVSEQAGNETFNRGMIKNIGFKEAARYGNFDCFIFNDVDVIPEDDRNMYHCTANPNHLSGKIDRDQYKHLYDDLVGGILAFQKEMFNKINGYSNRFFLWGSEDDNLNERIKVYGFKAERPLFLFSHCTTLTHTKDENKPVRFEIVRDANSKALTNNDGLNSLQYELLSVRNMKLYIQITSTINKTLILNALKEQQIIPSKKVVFK